MRSYLNIPEFRLVVPGKPESFRTKRAVSYKKRVRQMAQNVFALPLLGRVHVFLDYFHTRRRRMDMDNLSKCILDALTGVAYLDDRQVFLQSSVDHDLTSVTRISGCVDLVKPLADFEEYVFVRIRDQEKPRPGGPPH